MDTSASKASDDRERWRIVLPQSACRKPPQPRRRLWNVPKYFWVVLTAAGLRHRRRRSFVHARWRSPCDVTALGTRRRNRRLTSAAASHLSSARRRSDAASTRCHTHTTSSHSEKNKHGRRRRGRREGGTCCPSKIWGKHFSGNYHVKLGNFSGKHYVQFGNFVNFSGNIIKIRANIT